MRVAGIALQVFSTILSTTSVADPGTSGRTQTMKDLESDSPEARRSAIERIVSKRDVPEEDIRALAEKHMQGPKKGTAKDAILLLGRLRSTSSVPWLLDRLTFSVFYKETKRPQPPADRFPAVQALIDIGLPSIKPVLARAAANNDPEVRVAAGAVLVGILGSRGAVTRLESEIAAAREPAAKAALQATLDHLRADAQSR
jgi:HEAT repeat protein